MQFFEHQALKLLRCFLLFSRDAGFGKQTAQVKYFGFKPKLFIVGRHCFESHRDRPNTGPQLAAQNDLYALPNTIAELSQLRADIAIHCRRRSMLNTLPKKDICGRLRSRGFGSGA
jgi:hypothetical protein